MPKRKRGAFGAEELDPAEERDSKRRDVEKKLVHGKKLLNRALKTAKGFERQKLGKRLKLAAEKKEDEETERLQRELDVLKTLDISILVDGHLHKTLLKSKILSESKLLPGYVKAENKKSSGSPEEILAISNVTARMYNTKPVKEAMAYTVDSVYAILGVANPATAIKVTTAINGRSRAIGTKAVQAEEQDDSDKEDDSNEASDFDGIQDDEEEEGSSLDSTKAVSVSDAESEDFSHYDNRIANSSDDESDDHLDPVTFKHPTARKKVPTKRLSLSPSPPPRPAKSAKRAPPPAATPGSTFLPTLMGGYWSGSESATDDDELAAPPPRKNRRGQQARRAIAEKKYGKNAKHIAAGAPSVQSRDKDWDPKRGARSADDRGFRSGRGRGGERGMGDNRASRRKAQAAGQVTGENAIAVKPRARGMGMKDDAGPLHPSWEAKKKAKEAKTNAKFEGKKVVFD